MTEESARRTPGGSRARREARLEFDLGDPAQPGDNERLANLCGPLDANLTQIAAAFGVQISRRNARFTLEGAGAANRAARDALVHFHEILDLHR